MKHFFYDKMKHFSKNKIQNNFQKIKLFLENAPKIILKKQMLILFRCEG